QRPAAACGELQSMRVARVAASIAALLCLVACGSSDGGSGGGGSTSLGLHAHPQAIEPTAGDAPQSYGGESATPVGDPNARAPSLAEVKRELKIEKKIAQELNSLDSGQGFVFPISPLSAVEPPTTWS